MATLSRERTWMLWPNKMIRKKCGKKRNTNNIERRNLVWFQTIYFAIIGRVYIVRKFAKLKTYGRIETILTESVNNLTQCRNKLSWCSKFYIIYQMVHFLYFSGFVQIKSMLKRQNPLETRNTMMNLHFLESLFFLIFI